MADRTELTPSACLAALSALPAPSKRVARFLRAHLASPGKVSTAAELAKVAGYRNFNGINLQYGLLAARIGAKAGFRGASLNLLVEFVRPQSVTNRHWLLAMRPAFASALKSSGWLNG